MPLTADTMSLGAGFLYIAPLGSIEPTDLVSGWDAAWIKIGYTSEGHTMNYDVTNEDIMVAEVYGPVRTEVTQRKISIEFAMAEITATNLSRAMNGGTVTIGAGIVTVLPPSVRDAVTPKMLGWESFDPTTGERIVWRKCVQAKAFAIARKKAPDYATIPVSFSALEVDETTRPFKHIFDDSRA